MKKGYLALTGLTAIFFLVLLNMVLFSCTDDDDDEPTPTATPTATPTPVITNRIVLGELFSRDN